MRNFLQKVRNLTNKEPSAALTSRIDAKLRYKIAEPRTVMRDMESFRFQGLASAVVHLSIPLYQTIQISTMTSRVRHKYFKASLTRT